LLIERNLKENPAPGKRHISRKKHEGTYPASPQTYNVPSTEETIRTVHNTTLRQLAQCIGLAHLYDAALGGDKVHVFVEVHVDDVGLWVGEVDTKNEIAYEG
jgi:hypothetical protein